MADLAREMESIRSRLLEQGSRNGLLNHTPLKRTVSVVDESPRELYDLLVIQGRSMRLRHSSRRRSSGGAESVWDRGQDPKVTSMVREWAPDDGGKASPNLLDAIISTPHGKDDLDKRLFAVYNRSRSILEEQGYNVLYLALGFLQFSEGVLGRKSMRAPLILVPVELRRMGRTREYRLRWNGDEISTNISLQARLLAEAGVNLPDFVMPDDKSGIDGYLSDVLSSVSGMKGWKVLDEIHLDLFNFRRHIMYRDLSPESMEGARGADLVRSIFNPVPIPPEDDTLKEGEVDRMVDPRHSFSILDADSSQTAVVETVRKGSCLIVEGPPGTGKSQTIANIMAELMADGKKVLFVSEKMAALDVVKGRLDQCGLGDFCLEIHSDKMRKTAVLDELRRCLYLDKPSPGRGDRDMDELVRLREELNGYVEDLHSAIGVRDLTVYDLYAMRAAADLHFESRGISMRRVALQDATEVDGRQWSEGLRILDEAAELVTAMGPVKESPWRGCEPGLVLGPDIERIDQMIKDARTADRRLKDAKNRIGSEYGIVAPSRHQDADVFMESARLVEEAPAADMEMMGNKEWDDEDWLAEDIIEDLRALHETREGLLRIFNESVLKVDVRSLAAAALDAIGIGLRIMLRENASLQANIDRHFHPSVYELTPEEVEEYRDLSQRRMRFISGRWRVLRNDILSRSRKRMGRDQTLAGLERALRVSGFRQEMLRARDIGKILAGPSWRGSDTSPEDIRIEHSPAKGRQGDLPEDVEILDLMSSPAWDWLSDSIEILQEHVLQGGGRMIDERKEAELLLMTERAGVVTRSLSSHLLEGGLTPSEAARLLQDLVRFRLLERRIRSLRRGKSMFGMHWKSTSSDPEVLESYSIWIRDFRRFRSEGRLNLDAERAVATGGNSGALESAEDVLRKESVFRDAFKNISAEVDADPVTIFGGPLETVSQEDLRRRLNAWSKGTPDLNRWGRYRDLLHLAEGTLIEPVFGLLEEGLIEPQDMVKTFKGNYADILLKEVLAFNPRLRGFVKEIHERNITKFQDLDRRMLETNRRRVAERVHTFRPRPEDAVAPESEMGVLLAELDRKRGVMPIRKLMNRAGNLIQGLKPCFMMSPLSVAQFLDLEGMGFDVVIFDEASQVRPEDALGAILRGSQLVVVGDTRQLPPTHFFDMISGLTDEDDDEMLVSTGMESILGLCRRSFRTKTLRWHYRSRHESLIAVSNHEFYDDRLLIYPSPMHGSKDLGMSHIHIPETIYHRGRSGDNPLEAKAVAEMVRDHYLKHPGRTLGVGTFNVRQQEAVLREIEALVRDEPSLEARFHHSSREPLFVKNIETIQGDERDVIIVSVGFGFDDEGRLSNNFGPVNQEGGERRLNVLMTRAREKCVIVSNFHASDLRVTPDSPFGLRALRTFMEYAASGRERDAERYANERGGAFEEAVAGFIERMGYTVHRRVGKAGYRMELAIVDPVKPDRYLLGIEFDGPQYRSSPVARDRDRIRGEILNGLGWRTHRVWSTDWHQNPETARKGILDALAQVSPHRTRETVATKKDVSDRDLASEVEPYRHCPPLGMPSSPDLSSLDDRMVLVAMEQVVGCEGPIHKEALMIRLRDEFGVRRLSPSIRDRLLSLMDRADLTIRGDFLWPRGMDEATVRRREGTGLDIAWVADEELAAAIILVASRLALPESETIKNVARLLGFERIGPNIKSRISTVLNTMVREGSLRRSSDGVLEPGGT